MTTQEVQKRKPLARGEKKQLARMSGDLCKFFLGERLLYNVTLFFTLY